jgi:hypothetical protein
MSDRSFQRCSSTYGKAKWKGGTLTIQIAKENYLERLKKERQEFQGKTANGNNSGSNCTLTERSCSPIKSSHVKTKRKNLLQKVEMEKIEKPVSDLTWSFDGWNTLESVQKMSAFEHKKSGDCEHRNVGDCVCGSSEKENGDGRRNSVKKDCGTADVEGKLPTTNGLLHPQEGDINSLPIMYYLKTVQNGDNVQLNSSCHTPKVDGGTEAKRTKSEEKRRQAIDDMALRNKQLKISTASKPQGRHIVFDSSDEDDTSVGTSGGSADEEENEKVEQSSPTDSFPLNNPPPLRLFDESSESGEDSEGHFEAKPQFEGKMGEKLFRLQQRIGKDKRFQLDERFQSDEDASMEEESSDDEDKLFSKQIMLEKKTELGILDQILGKGTNAPHKIYDNSEYSKSVLFQPMRYDPESENCHELEVEVEPSNNKDIVYDQRKSAEISSASDSEVEDGNSLPQSEPRVTTERFYSVQGDLKKAFGGNREESAGEFKLASLFSSFVDTEEPAKASQHEVEEICSPKTSRRRELWINGMDDTSSDSEEEEAKDATTAPPDEVSSNSQKLFFFHPGNSCLRNRLCNQFKRNTSLHELDRKWPEMRKRFKQSFRQRRKDALRSRKRKLGS